MQKQNILRYTTAKCPNPTQSYKNPVMLENTTIFNRNNQQLTKKTQPNGLNYWKSMRAHTEGSQQIQNIKDNYQTNMYKDKSLKKEERNTFEGSAPKMQKGFSQQQSKFAGNFITLGKNDNLRRQKAPDFFPISPKDRKPSTAKIYNNFVDNKQTKYQPTIKIKQDYNFMIGSPSINYKQQIKTGTFEPQTYLKRTVKTESDQLPVNVVQNQIRPQMQYLRKSYREEMRKTQADGETSSFLENKRRIGAIVNSNDKNQKMSKVKEKTTCLDKAAYMNVNQNKQNRKTIFNDDDWVFNANQLLKRQPQQNQHRKSQQNQQNFSSFLNNKSNLLQGSQKPCQFPASFKRPLPQNDRKMARVNTEENDKQSKPYFFNKKASQNLDSQKTLKKILPQHQIQPTIYWKKDLMLLQKIGEGTFGKVYKAKLRQDPSSKVYAVKRVEIDKKYKNRQVQIVSQLQHSQVMKVYTTFLTSKDNKEYINIVMDFYEKSLYETIKENGQLITKNAVNNVNTNNIRQKELQQKLHIYQIFKGLSYIHSLGICHRDIKPHNILVNSWQLVLCDFGSAKRLIPDQSNLSYICSRCYRAPQLIFGATNYTTQIDIWSVGCVMLEMLNSVPLFIGENSLDHLLEVIKVVGTPSKEEVMGMNPNYDITGYELPLIKRKSLSKLFPNADATLVDLLNKILFYNPSQRLTAIEALAHPYFDELRKHEIFVQIQTLLPKQISQSLFTFSDKEIALYRIQEIKKPTTGIVSNGMRPIKTSETVRQRLVPTWMK